MAEVLDPSDPRIPPDPLPRRRWQDLPWEKYFDEQPWIFKPGVDFAPGHRGRFRQHAYHVAKYVFDGLKIKTRAPRDGTLIIQALPENYGDPDATS